VFLQRALLILVEVMVGCVWYAGLDRERAGRCICGLIVDPIAVSLCTEQTSKVVSGQVAKHKLLYSFSRASKAPGASQTSFGKDALNEKGFTDGDMVILSIEGGAAIMMSAQECCLQWLCTCMVPCFMHPNISETVAMLACMYCPPVSMLPALVKCACMPCLAMHDVCLEHYCADD